MRGLVRQPCPRNPSPVVCRGHLQRAISRYSQGQKTRDPSQPAFEKMTYPGTELMLYTSGRALFPTSILGGARRPENFEFVERVRASLKECYAEKNRPAQ